MLWFIYSAAAACLCVCVGVRLCTGAGYEAAAGLFFAGAALVISGLAVLLLHKLTNFVGRKSTKKKNEALRTGDADIEPSETEWAGTEREGDEKNAGDL